MAETMNQESVMRRLLMDCLLIGQDNSRNVGIVLRSRSRIFAFHEANWALANPIFEQLRSLSIPALDIIRYLKVLPRLSNLERVKIIMDDLLKISSGVRATTNILQPEINSRQEVIYDSIITFIEQHCKMFPGQLKTAEFPDGGFWVEASYSLLQGCPEHVRFKVYELLPPFQVTKVLTHFQLLQCLAHPFSDSLSHIKEIIQTNGPNRWLSHPEVSSEFILRCRSLETLYMQKVPEGIFKRAAEERRRMDSIGNTIPTATPTITTNNSLIAQDLLGKAQNSEENTYKLAPLTNVTLNDSSPTFVEDLRDLVVAFNRTLQKLVVQATVLDPSPDPMSSNCGHGWVDLPVLTHLDLDVGGRCLIIDEELLLHCRNLVLLKLVDKTIVYDSHKVTPCLPGNLPKLETLSLKGWSALTFDPSTLHSTTKLIDLSIKMQDGFDNIHYIPSLKELKNRPNVWTWDWYLPQLRHLKLSAEFAFQFQFKMLATCPALESLYLDSTTPDRRHPRYITHSDLFSTTTTDTVGVQRNQGNHSKPSAKKRIVAGKVKDLSMFGYCTIKSDVLTEFVRGMFPALEVLSISKWKGPNLEDYINMATGPGINSNDRETGDVYANKLTKLDLDLPRENMKYLRQLGLQKVEYLETSRPDNVIEGDSHRCLPN
ncbi:hypothetical protein FBU30_009339 [Linnemannia zychae]|nr:hypothetical protein FBU30_009339 [Linnemannia zychae]